MTLPEIPRVDVLAPLTGEGEPAVEAPFDGVAVEVVDPDEADGEELQAAVATRTATVTRTTAGHPRRSTRPRSGAGIPRGLLRLTVPMCSLPDGRDPSSSVEEAESSDRADQ
jgi:hypothetical protein